MLIMMMMMIAMQMMKTTIDKSTTTNNASARRGFQVSSMQDRQTDGHTNFSTSEEENKGVLKAIH